MLKLLIVDDETPTREWIAHCVEKSGIPCDIVALASMGQEALELFCQHLPDLIFADIEMPGMNGLELLSKIKSIRPDTDVVILTCHSDFAYAREAVKYGAAEYILKTEINQASIVELLRKFSQKNRRPAEQTNADLSRLRLRQELLLHRLLEQPDMVQRLSRRELGEQGIFLDDLPLFAMALRYVPGRELDSPVDDRILPGGGHVANNMIFTYDKNVSVLLANLVDTRSAMQQQQRLLEFARGLMDRNPFTVGLSRVYGGVRHLPKAVEDALFQLDQSFYSGQQSLNQGIFPEKDNTVRNEIAVLAEKILCNLAQKEQQELNQELDSFFTETARRKITNTHFVRNICCRLAVDLWEKILGKTALAAQTEESDRMRQLEAEIRQAPYLSYVKALVLGAVEEMFRLRIASGKSYSPYVAKAVQYIHQNYSENITLADLGAQVNLNVDYLSRLFKEDTGQNFVGYLTTVRLEQAAQLLTATNLRVHEVAAMVGYPNLSYFSRIFKKHYGQNPFDYRAAKAR